ncbi:MAG: prepilin-type N-terminal cleavage/methylation domain-containing protein [Elusimicrobia bacterium]|nr:prepilin-type N-terminal cleavage/methylation domain-containing protein [Elusimicrobiota bacterium]
MAATVGKNCWFLRIMSQNRGVLGQKNHGVTLFEVVISMAVIGIMIIVFVGSLRVASTSMVKVENSFGAATWPSLHLHPSKSHEFLTSFRAILRSLNTGFSPSPMAVSIPGRTTALTRRLSPILRAPLPCWPFRHRWKKTASAILI